MIQRIQSIYLLISAICIALLFSFPFVTGETTQEGAMQDGDLDVHDSMALLILVIAIIGLNVITIFLFRNRKLQMNMNRISLVVVLGLIATAAYFIFTEAENLGVGIGLFVPAISLILLFMANRAIYKDEKLVQSSDRLR